MALTINRKDEITETELNLIKQRFNQKTSSQAIYSCVKYVVNHLPNIEVEMNRLATKIDEVTHKYNCLLETVKKKHIVDSEFKSILFAENRS